jgi:hypothetical protein
VNVNQEQVLLSQEMVIVDHVDVNADVNNVNENVNVNNLEQVLLVNMEKVKNKV